MNAIILAAGMGRRMRPMGWELPKGLLPCPGGTLLDNALRALGSRGVPRVAIVVGYQRQRVEEVAKKHPLAVEFVVNEDYATTNTLHSLYLAREFLRDGSLYLNGDVWFRDSALGLLTPLPLGEGGGLLTPLPLGEGAGVRAMDAAGGTSALLVARGPCGPEEVKVFVDADNRVQRIGKDLDPSACAGEFIGIARFDSATGAALAHNLEQCAAADQSGQFFEFSLNQILARHAICAAFIDRNDAIEIDTPEDYETAKCMWSSP